MSEESTTTQEAPEAPAAPEAVAEPTEFEATVNEIDASLDAMDEEALENEQVEIHDGTADRVEDVFSGDEDSGAVVKDEPKAAVSAASEITDEVAERAIRAGLSLSEIKQYPSESLLNAMCDRIEGKSGSGSQNDVGEDSGSGEPSSADVLDSIPDLDPAEYDDDLVSAFKNMKDEIRRQQADNESLRESLEGLRGSQSKNWLDKKLDTVKKFTKGDAAKSASVREKFDALKAGYKATGKSVTDESVFGEAAKMVLGSEMQAASVEKKTEATRNRKGQFVARVGGNHIQGTPGDVDAEIAAELDKAFYS